MLEDCTSLFIVLYNFTLKWFQKLEQVSLNITQFVCHKYALQTILKFSEKRVELEESFKGDLSLLLRSKDNRSRLELGEFFKTGADHQHELSIG